MPLAVVAGDIGGPYVYPSTPPVYASFPMVSGSLKTFFNGRSVMLLGQATTAGGAIISASASTVKVFVEGRAVLIPGAVTILSTGWTNGVLQAGNAPNILVT